MLEEFKRFALRGNMVELAIGVIIGTAFSGLINSIVNDVFMPILGVFTGGLDFSNIYWQMVGDPQPSLDAARKAGATLAYGHFATVLINFLIISFVLFIVIKGLNRLQLATPAPGAVKPNTPTEIILADIRDILRREQCPARAKAEAEAKAAKPTAEAEAKQANTAAGAASLPAMGVLRRLKEAAVKTAAAAGHAPKTANAPARPAEAAPKAAPAPAAKAATANEAAAKPKRKAAGRAPRKKAAPKKQV